MSIVNKICGAIYAEKYRQMQNKGNDGQIKRVLCDHATYCDVQYDPCFTSYCNPLEVFEGKPIITIMGYPLVPTYEVEGFEIQLEGGVFAPKPEKGTGLN